MTTENENAATSYDANNDGTISYAERAGLLYHENEVIIDEDIELGVNGFCDSNTGSVPLINENVSLPKLK